MAEREERPGTSAAAAAAEHVRAIVEAAERSAVSLEAAAREDAARIRAEADAEAASKREAAERLAERADELEHRLDELSEGVRAAVAGLKEDLAALRAGGTDEAEPAVAGQPAAPDAEVDPTIAETEQVAARDPEVADVAEAPAPAPGRETGAAEESAPGGAAPEGARLLALKMALDGTPRDKTARYLRENFEIEDPEALLDEVYARAGG